MNPIIRKNKLCDWIDKTLQMRVHPSTIETAHPLGPVVKGKQTMMIKFLDRDVRDIVLDARKRLKGKGFVIHEDITKLNQQFMNRVRQTPKISDVWFYKEKIFCKVKNKGKKFKVDTSTNITDITA